MESETSGSVIFLRAIFAGFVLFSVVFYYVLIPFVGYWRGFRVGGSDDGVYIMVNQVGYFVDGEKIAVIRTDRSLVGEEALVKSVDGREVMVLSVGRDLGSGYGFLHHYLLNFTGLRVPGRYFIEVVGVSSFVFSVSSEPFSSVVFSSLNFFELNKCSGSLFHGRCHSDDGVIANGPLKGVFVNVSGGWHDAGDYIKFVVPAGEALLMLLFALEIAGGFQNDTFYSVVSYGLEWFSRLWLGEYGQLIYMVGNQTDHFQGFRLPEDDPLSYRPVYVCESGKGANVAGIVASVLFFAVKLSREGKLVVEDVDDYFGIAREVYFFGLENRGVQEIGVGGWVAYPEWGWEDEMSLASVLFYELTGSRSYLVNAVDFHDSYHEVSDVPYTPSNLLAEYFLGSEGYSNVTRVTEGTLYWNYGLLLKDPLFWPWPEYYWGSLYTFLILSFASFVHFRVTGDAGYFVFLRRGVDYVFGVNQWGVCFVTGFGTRYPRHLHHQVLYLKNLDVSGIMAEGGASKSLIQQMGIEILPPEEDEYSVFQSENAFYQDLTWNYVTNEPTIRAQALLFLVLVLYTRCLES